MQTVVKYITVFSSRLVGNKYSCIATLVQQSHQVEPVISLSYATAQSWIKNMPVLFSRSHLLTALHFSV